jgi:glycosyltransferase involved in cell wall biosynthesis
VRVLHLTDDTGLLGGVQRYLEQVTELLDGGGVECRVWAPSPGPLQGVVSRWYGRRYRLKTLELIDRHQPDVVHLHNLWMRLSPAPLAAARQAGVPTVVTAHDYGWICPRKWMITGRDRPCDLGFGGRCALSMCRGSREGLAWIPYSTLRWLKTGWHRTLVRRWADGFISPSRHLADWLEKSLGVAGVAHVPNFAPAPGRGGPTPVENPDSLVFSGRLSREKGVDVLLRAMPEIIERHPRTRLVIAGDGSERPVIERLIAELDLTASVRLTGRLPSDELEGLYSAAGLVVLPTMWMENCPVSVLEAFAHGRAVVASRVGGLPELIEDGSNGILFERGDSRDLARRLVEVLTSPEEVAEMGRRAAARWAESYTPEHHRQRLRAVYDGLSSGAV